MRHCILTAVATYNDAVVAAVQAGTRLERVPGETVYAASKTEAERQAWKWVEDNKPPFRFNTVVPDNVVRNSHFQRRALVLTFQIGSRVNPNVSESIAPVRAFLQGKDFFMRLFPPGKCAYLESLDLCIGKPP